MRLPRIIVAGFVCIALTGSAPAQDAPRRRALAPSPHEHYFIDFRARGGGVMGHTFVVYGRTDGGGRVLELHHAGLYPRDEFSESLLLPLLLVPGFVSLKQEDPRQPTVAVYRRRLSAVEFAHLKVTVRRLGRARPLWNFTFYNCNDFVMEIAHAIGLQTPPGLQLPEDFVRGIAMMNRR